MLFGQYVPPSLTLAIRQLQLFFSRIHVDQPQNRKQGMVQCFHLSTIWPDTGDPCIVCNPFSAVKLHRLVFKLGNVVQLKRAGGLFLSLYIPLIDAFERFYSASHGALRNHLKHPLQGESIILKLITEFVRRRCGKKIFFCKFRNLNDTITPFLSIV